MKRGFIASKLRSGKKSLEEISVQKSVETIQGENFTWIDLQNPDRAVVEKLASDYNLNALNVEDCLTKFELPKLDAYSDHIFLILHLPPLASKKMMPKFSQLSVFLGKDFLITIHQGDLKPLVDLVKTCKENLDPQRRERILGKSTGVLLHEIIDLLVDDLLHTLRRIIANLDDIEEGVFDDRKSMARTISVLRREITMLRRIVNPLKRIILETAINVKKLSPAEELTLYFDDVIDHIDKVIDTLEESRETMEIYKDTDFMLSTEKTNKVLGVLTIIFTLAIPATVIGTFYGMNINLPGGIAGEDSQSYMTFVIIIIASIVPAGMMFLYFRKLGWLSI